MMDENNLNNQELENEEVVEELEEVKEEIAEEIEEAEEVLEEYPEEIAYDEELEEAAQVTEEITPKNYKVSAIIAWVLVVVLAGFDVFYYMTNIYNKYNHMGYLDINGHTIGEAVIGMGMDFDEFKEMYGLPKDMKKDTNMNAAQSMIPVKNMAKLNNIDVETLIATYKFGEEITGDSTWGEAVASMALRDYVGEEGFAEFKAEYNLGDDVTLDTKWGEIRKQVEKIQVAQRLAEKEASDTEVDDAAADTVDDTAEEEAPEGEPAEDASETSEVPAE